MPFSSGAGLGVNNYYGPRDTGGSVGIEHGEDSLWRLSIALTPQLINGTYVPPVNVPRGALFRSAALRVDEAFTLTGTTPVLNIGAQGSEAANGYTLSQAELQAVGTKTPASTGNGTWSQTSATGTTANAKVNAVLGGTTPAVTGTAGKATLVLTFYYKTKV